MSKYHPYPYVDRKNDRLKRELLRQKNQNKVLKVILLTSLCIMFSISFVYALHSNREHGLEQKNAIEFLVQPGDTLWDISLRYKPQGEDTRSYLTEIMDMNRLESSTIQIGQILYLPH